MNHRFDGERKAGGFQSAIDQQQAGCCRQQNRAEQSGQQTTKEPDGTGMYADFAPDGQHVTFASITGLFVMQPDGSSLLQLINEGICGSMSWTP